MMWFLLNSIMSCPCKALTLFITSLSSVFLGPFAQGLPFIKAAVSLPLWPKQLFPSCFRSHQQSSPSPFPLLSFQRNPEVFVVLVTQRLDAACLPLLPSPAAVALTMVAVSLVTHSPSSTGDTEAVTSFLHTPTLSQ